MVQWRAEREECSAVAPWMRHYSRVTWWLCPTKLLAAASRGRTPCKSLSWYPLSASPYKWLRAFEQDGGLYDLQRRQVLRNTLLLRSRDAHRKRPAKCASRMSPSRGESRNKFVHHHRIVEAGKELRAFARRRSAQPACLAVSGPLGWGSKAVLDKPCSSSQERPALDRTVWRNDCGIYCWRQLAVEASARQARSAGSKSQDF